MSLDGAVRTTASPTTATVCALVLLLCITGPVLGIDDDGGGDGVAVPEEAVAPADSATILTAPPDSVAPLVIFGVVPDSLLPIETSGVIPDSLAPPEAASVLPDTLAPEEAAGAVTDTLEQEEAAGTESDSLASVDAPGAPADSLEASAADSSTVDAPPVKERDPYAPGVLLLPEMSTVFVRPWSTLDPLPKGLRIGRPAILPSTSQSLPFSRRLVIDHENGTVKVVTDAGKHSSWVAYAAPLDDYQRLAGDASLLETWKRVVDKSLGKAEGGPGRGLLDIDIPMPLPGPFVRAIGPGANLKVRGSERITFGGQTSYVVEALETELGRPSRFPQLDMQQQLTVNLEGTIGRKIHVYVDHRSGGDTFGGSKADQIRVHYDGDEDEIIQKIELGEVNLSLPGTEFVSYSGHHQGLFGAKMTAKVGKLDLVTVASKEEGKSAGASFTGTSESDSLVIKDISYKAGKFFVIDDLALRYSDVGVNQGIKLYIDDRILLERHGGRRSAGYRLSRGAAWRGCLPRTRPTAARGSSSNSSREMDEGLHHPTERGHLRRGWLPTGCHRPDAPAGQG